MLKRKRSKDPKLARAKRHLCEHLIPLLDELVAAGHRVNSTILGAWTECDVIVELKDGPTLKDLRANYAWPRGIVSGCNKDERAGPVSNHLYCKRCKMSIDWSR